VVYVTAKNKINLIKMCIFIAGSKVDSGMHQLALISIAAAKREKYPAIVEHNTLVEALIGGD
jgi:hypothetical protein